MAVALVGAVALGWGGATYLKSVRGTGDHTHPEAEGPLTIRLLQVPTPLPAFTMTDIDGKTISSDTWRGKVTIVNFWATWCPPCRAEIPDLVALQDKYRDQLQVIGVSQDEAGADVVRQFAAEHKINYPIVMSTPEIEKQFPGI